VFEKSIQIKPIYVNTRHCISYSKENQQFLLSFIFEFEFSHWKLQRKSGTTGTEMEESTCDVKE
jgi:hypothetical protein